VALQSFTPVAVAVTDRDLGQTTIQAALEVMVVVGLVVTPHQDFLMELVELLIAEVVAVALHT